MKLYRILSLTALLLLWDKPVVHANDEDPAANPSAEKDFDPFEGYNRAMYDINHTLDTVFVWPIAEAYSYVPSPARKGVRNVLSNLKSPVTFLNDILQGNIEGAGETLARTIINTTVGIGGLFDVATEMGVNHHTEDFGQTLAYYGVPSGPYFVIPLLGPSTFRDMTGRGVDFVSNPAVWALAEADQDALLWGAVGMDLLDKRTEARGFTEELKKAIDPYARVRSLYWQTRVSNINEGAAEEQDSPSPLDRE